MFSSRPFLYLTAIQVFLSPPASSVLTDPGPLCDGQSATLTCNITGGSNLEWNYGTPGGMRERIATIYPSLGALPPPDPVSVLGVEFTVSLLMPTSSHFVSQISFQASTMMNGRVLSCVAVVPMVVDEQVSLSVANSPGPPRNVRLSNSTNGTINSDVTIQWTPPSGENMTYTIVITPPPVSGVVMDTSNTEVTVTLVYNTPYTTSVSTSTPCPGPTQNISFTLVTCEFPVGVSGDVMLPVSGPAQTLYPEGSEIMYQCRPGFQPQRTSAAVCGSNGLWTPDPAQHSCIVDCNDPTLPFNANASIGEVTSTTEGSTVNFQCDEGFIPSGHNTTQIQCTRVNNTGQWTPNPATLLCIVNCSDPMVLSYANGSIGEVTSSTEGATVNFQCEEGLVLPSGDNSIPIRCTYFNNTGQWIPNPEKLLCGLEVITTTEVIITTTEAITTLGNDTFVSTSSIPALVTIVVPVVVVLVAALIILVVVVLVVVICARCKQGVAAKKEQNGIEMHEATPEHKAEYHTLQSRGYNADDEYSTIHHNHHVSKTTGSEEYSEVRADTKLKRNGRKVNVPAGDVSEYNQLNTNPPSAPTPAPPPDPSSGLVYADLGTAMPKKKKQEVAAAFVPQDQDKVLYSAIDPKATAALKKELDAAKIPSCNLDMMMIQIKKEVAPFWYEYGKVLALPDNVLKDINELEMADTDKLVEVLDYWFRKFPPGGGPTWKEVGLSVREIGLMELAEKLIKVETTGELPIEVSTRVEALEIKDATPPPVPPKADSDQEALLPNPRTASLKQQAPPRPPKAGTQTLPAAPPRPPKTQPTHLPARPPKPGLT